MTPLGDGDDEVSPVDPSAIGLGQSSSISIDISRLLHAEARKPATLGAGHLDAARGLTGKDDIAPLMGLISRSIEFALGFLELPHFRILILLNERDSISAAELVQAMTMSSRKTLRLLDSMESAGWLQTAVQGRGVSEVIAISEQGRALVGEVTNKRQAEIDEILKRMSGPDRTAIAAAFAAFADAAREPAIRRAKTGIAP